MSEIELKITHLPKAEIIHRLQRLGAKKVYSEQLVSDLFFAAKNRTRNKQFSTLRLRSMENVHQLTIKRKQKDTKFKVYEELQIQISDPRVCKKMLELLGYEVTARREKLREEYKYKDVVIEIDTYPGMLPYMEIESSRKASLYEFLHHFGVDISQTSKQTAKDLIVKSGRNPEFLVFKRHASIQTRA